MERTLLLFPIEFHLAFSSRTYATLTSLITIYLSCLYKLVYKLSLFHIVFTAICVFLALHLCVVPQAFVIPSRKIGKDNKTLAECVVLDPHHVLALKREQRIQRACQYDSRRTGGMVEGGTVSNLQLGQGRRIWRDDQS